MLRQRHTGSGSLRIVNQNINTSKRINRLLHNICNNCLVVRASIDIRLNNQYLNVIQPFQLFFCGFQLFYISPRNDQICTLFCISRCNSVAD